MTIVRANIKIEGPKGSIKDIALVDTGSALILLDRRIAKKRGVKLTNRKMKLTVADDHELVGDLAIVDKLVIESEELPSAHMLIVDFPRKLSEKLKALRLSDRCIPGISTLEILGLTPNVTTGKVEKIGAFIV